MNKLDLLLHPVRLRIVHAMLGGRITTTSELCARLPDVSKASVYRHVALLAEGGLREVEGEQRMHGAVERRYRLHQARAVIDRDVAAPMSLEEHRNGFAAAMAALLAEFNAYLDRERTDERALRPGRNGMERPGGAAAQLHRGRCPTDSFRSGSTRTNSPN
jgi:DNA-binding transcriptional ArsR family regulator